MNRSTRPRHGNLAMLSLHHNLLETPPPAAGGDKPFDFRSLLPEDLRKSTTFDPLKPKDQNSFIHELAKGYDGAQRMIGTARLEAPRDDWKPEQWKAFYQKLGAPEKPEEYGVPEFKFAEGLSIDAEKMKGWHAKFAELGFTKKQANELMKHYFTDVNGAHVGVLESETRAKTQAEQELRQEFGEKYDVTLDVARAVVKQHGSEEFTKFLGESGLANNPNMIRFLSKIGNLVMEDHAGGAGGGLPLGERSTAELEIKNLKIDKDFQTALNDRYHAGHTAAVEKWLNLHKVAANGS